MFFVKKERDSYNAHETVIVHLGSLHKTYYIPQFHDRN